MHFSVFQASSVQFAPAIRPLTELDPIYQSGLQSPYDISWGVQGDFGEELNAFCDGDTLIGVTSIIWTGQTGDQCTGNIPLLNKIQYLLWW